MHKHRLKIDLREGTIRPERVEIVELAPGELHQREPSGDYLRVREPRVVGTDSFVWTGLHEDMPAAAAAAAAELRRRGERLIHLAERVEQIEESTNG